MLIENVFSGFITSFPAYADENIFSGISHFNLELSAPGIISFPIQKRFLVGLPRKRSACQRQPSRDSSIGTFHLWLCVPAFQRVCLFRCLFDFQIPAIYDIKEIKTRFPGLPKEARSVSILCLRQPGCHNFLGLRPAALRPRLSAGLPFSLLIQF
jgi:hypothetical protein